MDDFTIRMLASVVGFIVGLVVGWTSRAARDVRDLREVVVTDEPAPRRPKVSRSDVVLGIIVVVTLVATVSSVNAKNKVDRLAECNQRVTDQLVRAVNERTQYSDAASDRNLQLQRAARDTVSTILDSSGTREVRQARTHVALVNYREALGAFEAVQAKARDRRREFPYPTQEDINNCR